jgi:hypothetical protein
MINYEMIFVMISYERWRGYTIFWMVQHNDWIKDNGFVSDEIISSTHEFFQPINTQVPIVWIFKLFNMKKILAKEFK